MWRWGRTAWCGQGRARARTFSLCHHFIICWWDREGFLFLGGVCGWLGSLQRSRSLFGLRRWIELLRLIILCGRGRCWLIRVLCFCRCGIDSPLVASLQKIWGWLPICLMWLLWLERNWRTFEGVEKLVSCLKGKLLSVLHFWDSELYLLMLVLFWSSLII